MFSSENKQFPPVFIFIGLSVQKGADRFIKPVGIEPVFRQHSVRRRGDKGKGSLFSQFF